MAIAPPDPSLPPWPPGYVLASGFPGDGPLLTQLMQRTYGELFPGTDPQHLQNTVQHYWATATPLWWVYRGETLDSQPRGLVPRSPPDPVGVLWMGRAVDQVQGDRHSHIFLLYVDPQHRRQGLGTALLHQAEAWAKKNHDRQITLQVFCDNHSALALYRRQGYSPQAITLVKPLEPPP